MPFDKSKSKQLKDKRFVVIIDENTKEELAVIRLTTQKQKNTTELKGYEKGNKKTTYFKHFVEVVDNENNPIKIDNNKFIINGKEYDLSLTQIKQIKQKVFKNCKQSKTNVQTIKKFKK